MSARRCPARLLRIAAALGACAPLAAQEATAPLELSSFPHTSLEITHRDEQRAVHKFTFDVWVADTAERAQQGLMFVSELPETKGMLFPLHPPRVENMWMKNTYIELDMLFIAPDGRVSKIIKRARPLSLDQLSSDRAVAAVLELRAGEADKLKLRIGDTVSWGKQGR
jgi:uncharacterized membrane protein (UPF0127 family)